MSWLDVIILFLLSLVLMSDFCKMYSLGILLAVMGMFFALIGILGGGL